jgi:hypothetical protein
LSVRPGWACCHLCVARLSQWAAQLMRNASVVPLASTSVAHARRGNRQRTRRLCQCLTLTVPCNMQPCVDKVHRLGGAVYAQPPPWPVLAGAFCTFPSNGMCEMNKQSPWGQWRADNLNDEFTPAPSSRSRNAVGWSVMVNPWECCRVAQLALGATAHLSEAKRWHTGTGIGPQKSMYTLLRCPVGG